VEKYFRVGEALDDLIRRTRTAIWITKARDTHLEYVTLITILQQLWFLESSSMLRYT